MECLIIYYKYIPIENPEIIAEWQKSLCSTLSLKGRIILATEGINGIVGGSKAAVDHYRRAMESHPLFGNIDFKESLHVPEDFPRLSVKVRREIVTLGISPAILSVKEGGIHLSPQKAHELIKHKKSLIILDARNDYESRVGSFRNAIKPPIKAFKELPKFIDDNKDLFKDKEVLMYCTAGVRCERASAYLKSKKIAHEVYQISGGIQRYVEEFPDGFFEGDNFVFDPRLQVKVTEHEQATCDRCPNKAHKYTHCANDACSTRLLLLCKQCHALLKGFCSVACQNVRDYEH